MNTIVKTGIVLQLEGVNQDDLMHLHRYERIPMASLGDGDTGTSVFTIYGDMHVVGQCALLYVPNEQTTWPKIHGSLSLVGRYFFRATQPHSLLVVEAQRIAVERDSIHELDLEVFVRAGGRVRV